jgi:hypothetical protein
VREQIANGDRRGQENAVTSFRDKETKLYLSTSVFSSQAWTAELYLPESSLIGQGIKMALFGSNQKSSYGGAKAENYSRL